MERIENSGCKDENSIAEQARKGYKKAIILLMVFATVILFRTFVMERIIVNGNSMFPTLTDSDVCIAVKYDIEPERYDIVIAKIGGQTLIKRVIGLPGETLEVKNGTVYIDGNPIDAEFDFSTENGGILSEPYTLEENEYFLMGDNRTGSYDSRDFGSVKKENIKGIVICRIYPFWEIEIYSR